MHGGFSLDAEQRTRRTHRRTRRTGSLATIRMRQHETNAVSQLLAENSTSMQKILGTGAAIWSSGAGRRDQGRMRARRRGDCEGCASEREAHLSVEVADEVHGATSFQGIN
jgi:hypothetical protein